MTKKRKEKSISEHLYLDDDTFIPDDKDEATFNDAITFFDFDDTPRKWVAHEKADKDGLGVRHHLLIFHVLIKASWFTDDFYPTLKDKCIQYHQERKLNDIKVTVDNFFKSYSNVEYSYLEIEDEDRNTVRIRKKFIPSDLIDTIEPYILEWYPTAIFFVQTLNADPYIPDEEDYYWIYRKVKEDYPQKFVHFFNKNCPHLNFNNFSSIDYRKSGNKIPNDLHDFINIYIRKHFPNAIKEEDNLGE